MTINLKHESNAFILFQGDDGKKEELFLSRIARVFFAFLELRSRLAREKASSVSSSAFADSHFFGYGKAMMANESSESRPFFFLFVLAGSGDEQQQSEPICQRRRMAAGRTMLVFFQVCCLVVDVCKFEGDDDKESFRPLYEAQGVIDIKSTLSLRRKCTSFLSFENGSLTRWYFVTHTQKKYWKHAGGIFKQINTLWREH